MNKKHSRLEVWNFLAWGILLLYVIFLVIPLYKVLQQSVSDGQTGAFTLANFKKFFGDYYYLSTLINSFKVSFVVMIFSLLLGVPLAYFYSLYKMKGARFLQIVIILCSMSAPFIGAYAWILLLGRNGLITRIILKLTGIQIGSIYGFKGITIALTCRMFPMVFLYTQGALKSIDNTLLEASTNLGTSELERFWKVVLPLCMPSILAAALLTFMRAMSDFGTPLLIGEGYRTFPVEIYNQFLGETSRNYNFASAIAVVAILITALVFFLQKFVASKFKFTINAMHTIEQKQANPVKNFLIHLYSYLLVFIAMAPQIYLVYVSFRKTNSTGEVFLPGLSLHSYELAFRKHVPSIFNTFKLGIISVALVIFLAVLVAYLVVRRPGIKSQVIDTLSMVPYIIPGSVVGIALILAFNTKPLVLTGTMVILVVAMMIRRIPYTIRSSVAILGQIPISVEEAARSLGTTEMGAFWKITFPMMSNGVISGGLLSWVTIITEMSSSIMLYSAKSITLTVATYVYVSRGADGPAAALATILSVLTFLSLFLFMKISKNKDVTM